MAFKDLREVVKSEKFKRAAERFRKRLEIDPVAKQGWKLGFFIRELNRHAPSVQTARLVAEINHRRHPDDRQYGISESFEIDSQIRRTIDNAVNEMQRIIRHVSIQKLEIRVLDVSKFTLAGNGDKLWLNKTNDIEWSVEDGTIVPESVILDWKVVEIIGSLDMTNED